VLASASWACTFGAGTSGWTVAAMLALQCLGFALFSSPNMTAIMNSVPPAIGSMASALGALSRSLGMLTGMLLAGGALAAHVGEAQALERPKAVAAALALAMSLRRSGPAAARSS
jgi:hypothetical protein